MRATASWIRRTHAASFVVHRRAPEPALRRLFNEPCWGYHFDVQTRVFFYPRTLAEHDRDRLRGPRVARRPRARRRVRRRWSWRSDAGEFFARHVPQTDAGDGAYFGYLPGDRDADPQRQHARLRAARAPLGRLADREDCPRAAQCRDRVHVQSAASDGSWPYGEQPHLDWVDGFHTGYVLDCLLTCFEAGIGGSDAEAAWRRGLRLLRARPDRARRHAEIHARRPLSDRRSVRGASYPDAVPRRRA